MRVVPVPGPSALTATVSVAGFANKPFLFLGFLPSRAGQRRKLLESLASEPHHLVFYEAPHRIIPALEDCQAAFGERQVFVARELTKLHEEQLDGFLSSVLATFYGREKIKGEAQ